MTNISTTPRWLLTLLRLREQAREEARRQVDDAQRAWELLSEKKIAVERQDGQLAQLRREESKLGACDLNRLLAAQRHQSTLQFERQQLLRQMELVSEEISRRRSVLLEAEREVRVLEKLREKKEEVTRRLTIRREAKRMDELPSLLQQVDNEQ